MFPNLTPDLQRSFLIADGLPNDYRGMLLSGSKALHASGKDGTMTLQEFRDEAFYIQYSSFHFLKKSRLVFEPDPGFMHAAFAMKNRFIFRSKEISKVEVKANQFFFLHRAGEKAECFFEENKEHCILDIHYSKGIVKELVPYFPELHSFFERTEKKKPFAFIRPGWVPFRAMDTIQHIFRAQYEKNLQHHYLGLKIKENLLELLFNEFSKALRPDALTDDELGRIAEIAALMKKKIDEYFPVPFLARKAHMNENKLQAGFKEIYGKGVFEYQRDARLEEARRLIVEERRQIKHVFSSVGYRSITAFITEFHKYFGYTPGSLKKKP